MSAAAKLHYEPCSQEHDGELCGKPARILLDGGATRCADCIPLARVSPGEVEMVIGSADADVAENLSDVFETQALTLLNEAHWANGASRVEKLRKAAFAANEAHKWAQVRESLQR